MVLRYYGEDFHSWDYAEARNLNTEVGVSIADLKNFVKSNFPTLIPKVGNYFSLPPILADIQSNLTAGFPVIIFLGNSNFNHFVVAVGYNQSGLFVNDPSGALFVNYLNLSPRPITFNHAYVDWSNVRSFIRIWPADSLLAIEGIHHDGEKAGTIYTDTKDDIVFHKAGTNYKNDIYNTYLDRGLKWCYTDLNSVIIEDSAIPTQYSKLSLQTHISNSRADKQSFRIYVDLLNSIGFKATSRFFN